MKTFKNPLVVGHYDATGFRAARGGFGDTGTAKDPEVLSVRKLDDSVIRR